ncbi:hypothetical protein BH09BAC1_BH09BAC1_15540 [soil metagenome]
MKVFLLFIVTTFSAALYGQIPVEGDGLPKLLGQQKTSSQIQSLEAYIGGEYEPKGIKLLYNPDGKLIRIELFNGNNPWGENIQQFQGKMPFGIVFTDKIVTVKKKIGEGFEGDGEVSATYFLIKQFQLTNFDSYKLSAEFITGKLISVSMILEEGGSGSLMADGSVNKSGFMGESLITMVKKSKGSLELQKLITLFETFYSYSDKTHLIYAPHGLEVITDNSGTIQEVLVYSANQTTSQGEKTGAFKYPLPYSLRFQDSRNDVIQKLGAAAGEENGALYYNYGPSRMNVYFGGSGISKVVITANKDYKKPEPPVKKSAPTTKPADKK